MVTITSRTEIAIEIGTTLPNASLWPTRYAAANTSSICSVAYAVDDSASEAKIARAVFLVSRSCAKRAVLIGLPTSRRFNEAIFHRGSKLTLLSAQKCHSVQLCEKRQLWRTAHPMVACCFIVLKQTQSCIRAVYTGSAFESQWADGHVRGKVISTEKKGA